MRMSDELKRDLIFGKAIDEFYRELSREVARAAFMEIDEAIMGPEASVEARFRELLAQHPKMTQEQAYLLAVMERVGYQGYLVPPELAPGVLARLEANDRDDPRGLGAEIRRDGCFD